MATIYRPDGTQEERQPADGQSFQLAELQAIVGEGAPDGYIEIIPTATDGRIMVLNESGKLYGLPHNGQATALVHLATVEDIAFLKAILGEALLVVGDGADVGIVGTVLVCDEREVE